MLLKARTVFVLLAGRLRVRCLVLPLVTAGLVVVVVADERLGVAFEEEVADF